MTTLPRNSVDLHTHTARSDGVHEPLALYEQMRAWGSTLVAITDHDSLAGVRELVAAGLGAAAGSGPRIIVGVEINTLAQRHVAVDAGEGGTTATPLPLEHHILGLGVDPADAAFEALLAQQRLARERRLRLTLERLEQLGLSVEGSLPQVAGGIDALGRPHVARALVAAGHARDVPDAFERYLVPGRPAYVRRQGMGPRAAIEAITAAGGIASLAHAPWAPAAPDTIDELMGWGLRALEVHYRGWDSETVARMSAFAEARGLLATGGSDYHGDGESYAEAQAGVFVPEAVGRRLEAALATRRAA